MYNGTGLQTPRGSGTNGYINTNKFFAKPKPNKIDHPSSNGVDTAKKPSKEILEHERKRQIHLKLVELEDELIELGYSDAEITERMEEARRTLEAASAASQHL
ncbi:Pre-mRNA-splicing factor CWC21 [Linum perenne]